MESGHPVCYTGKMLRVNLTDGQITEEGLTDDVLRKYIGGTCLGAKYLYDEVPPGVEWSDPENRLILASGPLGGTRLGGSGAFSVVTKGALTNGATSTQANGFLGAFLKFSGFDGIIFQGAAKGLVYLYVHDGKAELRDASHLVGKNTRETEDAIKAELGYKEKSMSVYSIGPAGENLVRFACLVGDRGHVAAHNGVGAVLGSKKLKAIAVARGKGSVAVHDREKFSGIVKEMEEAIAQNLIFSLAHQWGTMGGGGITDMKLTYHFGYFPIKNYSATVWPIEQEDLEKWSGEYVRANYDPKPTPCWGCKAKHCHTLTIPEGPYKGMEVEEPEYECLAAWGPLIGQPDQAAAIMLSEEVDRLGVDTNEAGYVISLAMECYEKGLLTREQMDGMDLTWGNVEAVRTMLYKIANREGFGDVLAEGVMRAAQHIGGEAPNFGVHTMKGNAPRGHDHRIMWSELFDTCVSSTGTIEAGITSTATREEFGLPPTGDPFSPKDVSEMVAGYKVGMPFEDSAVTCRYNTGNHPPRLSRAISAATGWDFTAEEGKNVGLRAVNLLRMFNLRHGVTKEQERPSPRYGSTPDGGPAVGRSIMDGWDEMLSNFYRLMGWDQETGVPLPETLEKLGLGHLRS